MNLTDEEKEKVLDQMTSAQAKRIVTFLDIMNKRKQAITVRCLKDVNVIYGQYLQGIVDNGDKKHLETLDRLHNELIDWGVILEKTCKNWDASADHLFRWIKEYL